MPAAELQRQLMEACKFKIMANEAAVQLAPYVHSKMPTLMAQSEFRSRHAACQGILDLGQCSTSM